MACTIPIASILPTFAGMASVLNSSCSSSSSSNNIAAAGPGSDAPMMSKNEADMAKAALELAWVVSDPITKALGDLGAAHDFSCMGQDFMRVFTEASVGAGAEECFSKLGSLIGGIKELQAATFDTFRERDANLASIVAARLSSERINGIQQDGHSIPYFHRGSSAPVAFNHITAPCAPYFGPASAVDHQLSLGTLPINQGIDPYITLPHTPPPALSTFSPPFPPASPTDMCWEATPPSSVTWPIPIDPAAAEATTLQTEMEIDAEDELEMMEELSFATTPEVPILPPPPPPGPSLSSPANTIQGNTNPPEEEEEKKEDGGEEDEEPEPASAPPRDRSGLAPSPELAPAPAPAPGPVLGSGPAPTWFIDVNPTPAPVPVPANEEEQEPQSASDNEPTNNDDADDWDGLPPHLLQYEELMENLDLLFDRTEWAWGEVPESDELDSREPLQDWEPGADKLEVLWRRKQFAQHQLQPHMILAGPSDSGVFSDTRFRALGKAAKLIDQEIISATVIDMARAKRPEVVASEIAQLFRPWFRGDDAGWREVVLDRLRDICEDAWDLRELIDREKIHVDFVWPILDEPDVDNVNEEYNVVHALKKGPGFGVFPAMKLWERGFMATFGF
ncbi:hypothetical protein SODALDRAFT_377860 [Sodiomyces alkalinus F11]|uniref:Uncharacterized protein n=1 Tax=Sodiomyces alkalinus (strain CBS 110278 / VKM F-3762 / F11) TaxID=1314773 RepID=A0A3N2PZP8_SODAK|nr:hypothetical protein SODALDRAFT_377860 [Sodiomyces alkalinus F11]ROT39962.1 hypothetical protein SODALDRAFT_377860 [Sodiomyces alkalinus F11]